MAAPTAEMTLVVTNTERHLIYFGSNVYNYKTQQWTAVPAYSTYGKFSLINAGTSDIGLVVKSAGSVDLQTQTAAGEPQTVTITTAATDLNQQGRTVVDGIRPRVNGGTPTIRIGVQDQISDAVTWSTSVSLNSRTGYGNIRSEGRFIRAEVTVADSFTTIMGADVNVKPQGKV